MYEEVNRKLEERLRRMKGERVEVQQSYNNFMKALRDTLDEVGKYKNRSMNG